MNSWVWERYYENLKESNSSLVELLQDRDFCKKILNDRNAVCSTRKFYGKIPHSRQFKVLESYYQTNDRSSQIDNYIATFNEYLFAKKYKELGFLTANHQVIDINKIQLDSPENLGVVSEDLLSEEFEYITLENFFQSRKLFITHSNEIIDNKYQVVEHKIKHKILPYFSYLLPDILKYKKHYLQFLTENCYDKIIENFLLSLFEFGDDDHTHNTILIRRKGNRKFEELLVFDKESTAFSVNFPNDINLETIKKYYTTEFTSYNPYSIHIYDRKESFEFKCHKLFDFIKHGQFNKKYWQYLETIANLDYNKIAQQVKEEIDLTPPNKHIDILKYGSECAGKLYEICK